MVDSSELNTLSPATVETIAVEAANLLRDNGFEPHQLQLSLIWIDRMEFTRGVRAQFIDAEFELPDEDDDDPRGPIVSKCTGCGEPEFKTVSLEGVLEAIDRYHDTEEAATQTVEEPEVEPQPPPPPPPQRPGLGPLGGAGVTALSLGGAALAAGVVLVALPTPTSKIPAGTGGNDQHLQVTSTFDLRPPGFAILGTALAVTAVGAVLLVLDRKRNRHRDTMAVAPLVGPKRHYGVALSHRF